MDKASLIGSLIMAGAVGAVCYMATEGDIMALWSQKGMIMVVIATAAALFMAMPIESLKNVPGYAKRFFFHKGGSTLEIIQLMQALAEKARRDGILSLEADAAKIKNPFLASGLKLAIDGTDPDTIEATLRMEVLAMQDRHKSGKKFFDIIKVYAPGLGLVATLIGQIGMFKNLGGEIAVIGYMLAVAVVATLYGTLLANCVAGPVGDKLALRSSQEILGCEMMLQGILSIQAGENPRTTLDKMAAFVPGPQRMKIKVA